MTDHGKRARTWLQAMLWANRSAAQAQASLRREISNLLALLDAHGMGDLPLPPRPSLVLLPLAGRGSPDADQIASAVTDENELTLIRYRSLFLVASASGEALQRQGLTIPDIARRLGVAFVLHGSLERQGGRIKAIILISNEAEGMQPRPPRRSPCASGWSWPSPPTPGVPR